jgi:Ribbon-helix-helix protein, copG family
MYHGAVSKHRTQLFLDADQYDALAHLARHQQRSISGVVRDLIDRGLEQTRGDAQRRLEALATLAELGRAAGPLEFDPVAEARRERRTEVDRVLSERPRR